MSLFFFNLSIFNFWLSVSAWRAVGSPAAPTTARRWGPRLPPSTPPPPPLPATNKSKNWLKYENWVRLTWYLPLASASGVYLSFQTSILPSRLPKWLSEHLKTKHHPTSNLKRSAANAKNEPGNRTTKTGTNLSASEVRIINQPLIACDTLRKCEIYHRRKLKILC